MTITTDETARYEVETRSAYQNPAKALSYVVQQSRSFRWARVTTWREVSEIRLALRTLRVPKGALVLDVPCGAGVMAPAFAAQRVRVVATDISREMMAFGEGAYDRGLVGFVQADITQLPFPDRFFEGAVVIGFLHRVPRAIRSAALTEIARVTRDFVVVSVAVDSAPQRLKHRMLAAVNPAHWKAPAAMRLTEITEIAQRVGLRVHRQRSVVPFLSSERILWLAHAQG